jgi:uncharacterized protein YbgA (DUF1722 family)
MPRAKLRARYEVLFMATLFKPASIHRHAKVLKQMVCQLGKGLDAPSRNELLDLIGEYRRGRLPRIVPITRIRRHVRLHGISSLARQTYLDSDPQEGDAGEANRVESRPGNAGAEVASARARSEVS